MSLFESRSEPSDLFRPFLWLALLAFLIGFSGYLVLGAGRVSAGHGRGLTPVSAPAVAAWNGAKAI
jgi:hypothetical protein